MYAHIARSLSLNFVFNLLPAAMAFDPDSLGDLTGKVYIVTGGSGGMCVLEHFAEWLDINLQAEDTTLSHGLRSMARMYTCAHAPPQKAQVPSLVSSRRTRKPT